MKRTPVAGALLAVFCLTLSTAAAGSSVDRSSDTTGGPFDAGSDRQDTAPLDAAYRFDAEGLLSLAATSRLPVPRGSVTARWYAVGGWAVVVFEGLDLSASGPLCLGASAIDEVTGLLSQVSFAPTEAGACDDAGAGPLPRAGPDTGVRVCREAVAFVTRIPAESGGPMIADAVTFDGDGTGTGVTGRLEAPRALSELDRFFVDCGPLPPVRDPRTAVPVPAPTPAPTAAPASTGVVPAADRAPAPVPVKPATCAEPAGDGLEEVLTAPAGPYLVSHPAVPDESTATIIFLPGGGGGYGSARRAWETFFSSGRGFERFRVAIPYSVDNELMGEAMRIYDIVDELLGCHGGDPMKVHIAGTSNGGLAAFGLMVRAPERFATLLGAPGAFPVQDPADVDPDVWLETLAGRAVFNGVGAYDTDWRSEVIATHNALAAAGVESEFIQFESQGHVPTPRFDSGVLLRFWESYDEPS